MKNLSNEIRTNEIRIRQELPVLLTNSNHKMTLIGNLIRKEALEFLDFCWKTLAIVFYYEQSDRTCLDILRHILIIYDMFSNCQTCF